MLNQAVWNAFAIYTKLGDTSSHSEFRILLSEGIIAKSFVRLCNDLKLNKIYDLLINVRRLTGHHSPSYVLDKGKLHRSRFYAICCSKKKESLQKTRFQLVECDIGRFAVSCFEIIIRLQTLRCFK